MAALLSLVPGGPKPIKVLCYYKVWSDINGRSLRSYDSIMISVYKSKDIPAMFRMAMYRRYKKTNEFQVGPTPSDFKLVSFICENGLNNFNVAVQS